MKQMRNDKRQNLELRKIQISPYPTRYAEGGVDISFGQTRVLCTASVENGRPQMVIQ